MSVQSVATAFGTNGGFFFFFFFVSNFVVGYQTAGKYFPRSVTSFISLHHRERPEPPSDIPESREGVPDITVPFLD